MVRANLDRLRRSCRIACAAGFVLAIFAPLLDQLVRPAAARDSRHEFRAPAPQPRLVLEASALQAFPRQFEDWYQDTFGLRDMLLRWHNVLRWYVLSTSPSPRIVLGKQGWIFSRARSALEDHRGALPMHIGELERWRVFLERRRDWLSERGAAFVFVIPPNKNQVYPELVPERFAPIGPTRLDQLTAYLRQHSDLNVLDLRPALLEERRNDREEDWTYYPLGTHWTDRGAYAGYAALIERLSGSLPGLAPLPRQAFVVERRPDQGDSWAGRLYMSDLLQQHRIGWSVRAPRARLKESLEDGLRQRYERADAGSLPTGLFLHDSFGEPLRPWLAEHMSRLDCAWTADFEAELIDALRPDLVIQLLCEYTLVSLVPQSTPLEDGSSTRARFEAAQQVLWQLPTPPDPHELDCDSSLVLEDGVLRLERARSEELLYLPELDYPPDRTMLMLVEVETQQAGLLQVYYGTAEAPGYHRNRAVQGRLVQGRSSTCFVLPPRGFAGRLALRIGSEPGSYTVHRIEIRVALQ